MHWLNKHQKERVHSFSSWFLRGILVQAPIIAVLAIAGFFIGQAEKWLGPFFAFFFRLILPASWLDGGIIDSGHIPGLPLILWLVLTVVLGRFALWRFGQRGLMLVDHIFLSIPGISYIYRFVRDIVATIADKKSFQRVVWVAWPHPGTLQLALVSQELIDSNTEEPWVACLVASVPNTTTGYVNFFPADQVWDAEIPDEAKEKLLNRPMLVSEAMTMLISLGTKIPNRLPISRPTKAAAGDTKAD